MMNALKMAPNALFFAPFKFGKHWVLVIIAPSLNCAIWLDPLGKEQREFPQDVNTCLRVLVGEQPTMKKHHFWMVPKCPRQNDSVSCRYFVLRYMRDLISKQWNAKGEPFDEDDTPYTMDDIDEVKQEWLDYVAKHDF